MSDLKGIGEHMMSAVRAKLDMAQFSRTDPKNLNSRANAALEPDKALEAATQFESILVQQMMKSMWQSVPKSGLISGGYEEELYQEMLQRQISEHIAEHQSFGIRDMVLGEMTENAGKKKD